jgi:hypothetical protein
MAFLSNLAADAMFEREEARLVGDGTAEQPVGRRDGRSDGDPGGNPETKDNALVLIEIRKQKLCFSDL